MTDIEKQLNNLPKGRLSLKGDIKFRVKFFILIIKSKIAIGFGYWNFKRLVAVPVTLCLLGLIIIIPGYAYASNEVVAGNLLYPLKLSLEKIELAVAPSELAKVKVYTKIAERRVAEAQVISEKVKPEDKKALDQTIQNALESNNQAVSNSQNLAPEDKKQAEEIIKKVSEQEQEKMKQIANQVGITDDGKTSDNIAMAIDKISQMSANFEAKKIENRKSIGGRNNNLSPATTSSAVGPEIKKIEKDSSNIFTATTTIDNTFKPGQNMASSSFKSLKFNKVEELNPPTNCLNCNNNGVKKNALNSLDNLKNNIDNLKLELNNPKYEQRDVKKLFDRLDNKMEKAKQAIDDNKTGNLDELLKTTEALVNNGKYFIKTSGNKLNNNNQPEEKVNSLKETFKKAEIKLFNRNNNAVQNKENKEE